MSSTSAASPIAGPQTIDSWLAASRGDASGLWLLSVLSQLVFPTVQVKGEAAAFSRADAAFAARDYAHPSSDGSILGRPGTDFLWLGGRLRNAWPAGPDDNAYSRVRRSNVATLLIGGGLDFATPPQVAKRQLLPYLPNGHQVVLPNLGHTDDFWSYEPAASSRLVNTFLANGKVDESGYTFRPVDFTPGFTQTKIAKIVLAVLVGLPAIALLSLVWLAVRVRYGGRLGRKAAAVTRSLWVLVLGLGGWLAGALVVLTALPTVALDSDVVAGLAVGAPVGLGIYLAWVDTRWTARVKTTGLASAVGGALVGAWLGCNAIGGLYAVVTATVGAAIGANLILLVLDVTRDRPRRTVPARVPTGELHLPIA
jgi:hypothetical protein